MKPAIIKTRKDYDAFCDELERLMEMNPAPGSAEADDIELLSLLIGHWEKNNVKIPHRGEMDAIEAIEFMLECNGKTRKDLEPLIGDSAMVSRVMSRKRQLSKTMIQNIHENLGVPISLLLSGKTKPDENKSGLKLPLNK